MDHPTPAHREKTFAGMALIASPLILLAAAIVHPSHRTWDTALAVAADHRERWYLGHVLVLVALALLVAAVLGLTRTMRGLSGGLWAAGAALTVVGAIGVGALVGVELVVWQMAHPSLDQMEMAALADRLADSPGVVVPLFGMLAALAVGIGLSALALERSSAAQRWQALLGGAGLAIAIVAFPVPAAAIPAAVCAIAGLGSVGWMVVTDALAPPGGRSGVATIPDGRHDGAEVPPPGVRSGAPGP